MNTPYIDPRAARSRIALLKTGLSVLITNKEASLTEIAQQAGVGRATVYRQFETRESLIEAIAIDCVDRMKEITANIENEAASGLDAFRLLFLYMAPFTKEMQFLMHLDDHLRNDELDLDNEYERLQQEILGFIVKAQSNGDIRQDLPADWIVNFIDGLFFAGWMQQEAGASPELAAELMFASFSTGASLRTIIRS